MNILKVASSVSCPAATRNTALNESNRQRAVQEANYGPLDLSDENYWDRLAADLSVSVEEAKSNLCGNCGVFDVRTSMLSCIGENTEALGYCRIFEFTCSAKRTCTAWVSNGPISD